jgi:hypothetical protein
VIIYGIVFILAGWLGSPTGSARSARRLVTPLLRDQVPAVAGLFVAAALIFLLLGVGDTRTVLTRLILIGFAAFGLVYLRRHTIEEFPKAEMPDVPDSIRGGMESMRGWFARRPAGPSGPEDLKLARLERLAGLRERGALTKKEFDAEKKALLSEEGDAGASDSAE